MSILRPLVPIAALAVLLAACGGNGAGPGGGAAVSNTETAPTTEPTTPSTSEPDASDPVAADCSAAGLDLGDGAFLDLTEDARATAELILDAGLRCDEQILATAAFESETGLTFGNADPYEFFGLPEQADAQVYEVIARLLAATQPGEVYSEYHAIWVWPAVATAANVVDDNAWQDRGLYTAEEIDELRTQSDGYLGWRIAIADDGTWQYLVAGD